MDTAAEVGTQLVENNIFQIQESYLLIIFWYIKENINLALYIVVGG